MSKKNSPRICAVITRNDPGLIAAASRYADLFEVRIDLIGGDWLKLAKMLRKPWLATNRLKIEGGAWDGSEEARRNELLKAAKAGASIVDVELASPDIGEIVPQIKKYSLCLVSHHNNRRTPASATLRRVIEAEIAADADICKLVTTARNSEDNLTILSVIGEYRQTRIVAFAQGPRGQLSRLLCPLAGGDFTYAAIDGAETAAPGQLTLSQMRRLYGVSGL
ncbi:MAG: type I 3-dehydroquinate dehydratase [Dehalococcoidia bacterium]|nr:type I 3-dehydroquinate dehydratase [Dehalococcoidia bacterium]